MTSYIKKAAFCAILWYGAVKHIRDKFIYLYIYLFIYLFIIDDISYMPLTANLRTNWFNCSVEVSILVLKYIYFRYFWLMNVILGLMRCSEYIFQAKFSYKHFSENYVVLPWAVFEYLHEYFGTIELIQECSASCRFAPSLGYSWTISASGFGPTFADLAYLL